LLGAAALICACAIARAAPLAPNDPAVSDGLRLWLRTPHLNYDTDSGVWTDSSGNGHDTSVPPGNPDGHASASFTKPDLLTGQSGTIFGNSFSAIEYETDSGNKVFELLGATNINGDVGFSNLTIIAVLRTTSYAGTARPVGVGSLAVDGITVDNYNLGCDPSIRKDNGSLGSGAYTGSNTRPAGYFIRASRMMSSNSNIDEWFTVTAADGFEHVLHLDSGAFATRLDEFYLGTLWTRSGSSGSDTVGQIAEVAVYNSALTEQQIADINDWLLENVGVPLAAPPLVTNALSPAALGATNIVASNDADYSGTYRVSSSNTAGQTFAPTASVFVSAITFQLGADSSPFGADDTIALQVYEGTNLAQALGEPVTRSLENLSLVAGDYVTFALTEKETDGIGLLQNGQTYALALSSSTSNGIFISRSVPPGENPAGTDEPTGQGFEDGVVDGSTHLHDTEFYVQGEAPPPPEAPTALTAAAGNRKVTLDWDDATQQGFSHFAVKRSQTQGGPYVDVATPSNSDYANTGLVNGVTYYYVVTAVNLVGAESGLSAEVNATPTNRPNFVFIIVDDMAPHAIGPYGNAVCQTPVLDQLAADGMLFHGAHHMGSWSGAVCSPSRRMIMCGRTVWRIPGRPNGGGPVPADMPDHTLPAVFNAAGYDTFRTCKNGNSYDAANALFTVRKDATKRNGTDSDGSAWHADRVLDYLQARIDSSDVAPFLIYYGFSHPHDPRHGKPDLLTKYGAVDPGPPATPNPAAPPLQDNYLFEHPFFHGHHNLRDETKVQGVGTNRNEATIRNELGKEYACIENIDTQVGRVLQKLDEMGELDNTYIFFTADHGIAVGRHGLTGKQNLYEHTWRVPFIARGPGIASGSETDDYIYLLDVMPTLCDLADIGIPATADGISFKPTLEGNATNARDVAHGVYSGGTKPGMRSVKKGRWKLIKYDVDSNKVQETQLFDLETNPGEFLAEHAALGLVETQPHQIDLARHPAYALIRQELEELMMQQRKELEDPYQFLGDRTLLRFEEGTAGQPAGVVLDSMPWENSGTARSGNAGSLPACSPDTPGDTDYVVGRANALSLDFERDDKNYVEVDDSRELSFGSEPFTIEAWVKLETLPTDSDLASRFPVAQKKVLGLGDEELDYMFLAAAGNYGNSNTYNRLALKLGLPTITSTLSIPDTEWHYISVAFDPVSDTVRFTLDDQVDTQTTTSAGKMNNGPLIIGAHFNSSSVIDSTFDGLIDEFSVTVGFLALEELQPLAGAAAPGSFRIKGFSFDESGQLSDVTFESNEQHLYDIQVSPSLTPASWTTVQSFFGGAAGAAETTIGVPPPSEGAPRAYTRIRCRTPARP